MILFIGDVNGDGLDDLVVWNSDSGTCQVWLSTGKQLVDAGDWYSSKSPMGSSISMMLGDVDGDGLEDLILVEHTAGNWFVRYARDRLRAAGRTVWALGCRRTDDTFHCRSDGKWPCQSAGMVSESAWRYLGRRHQFQRPDNRIRT